MYRCVIFDFDGTLGNTEDLALKVAVTLAEKYNFRSITRKEIPLIKGMTPREGMAYMGISRFRLPFIVREAHQILKSEMSRVPLCRPGLSEALVRMAEDRILLGIITSNSRDNVEAFLALHGIQVFGFIRSSSVFGKSRHFRKIRKRYRLERRELLYVGDECRDIHAARRAGIPIAVVTWGFNSRECLAAENPDYLVETVEELEGIVRGAGPCRETRETPGAPEQRACKP